VSEEFEALYELLPLVRSSVNKSHSQPADVCYHLLGGDTRWQFGLDPLLDDLVLNAVWYPCLLAKPNDWAVHRDSAYALKDYFYQYPNTVFQDTPDLHGTPPWPNSLRSLVHLIDTFNEFILPNIGSSDCPRNLVQKGIESTSVSNTMNVISQPLVVDPTTTIDVATGLSVAGEVISGQFDVSDSVRLSRYDTFNSGG
jgi:hypothetical protein